MASSTLARIGCLPDELATHELPDKKGADHHGVGDELKPKPGKEPAGDDKRNRKMNGQDPLTGEFRDVRAPVPEREIQGKNDCSHDPQSHAPSIQNPDRVCRENRYS